MNMFSADSVVGATRSGFRRGASLALLVLLTIAVGVLATAPAGAAPKSTDKKIVQSFEDPEYWAEVSEFVSDECGFEVEVEIHGWVQIIPFNEQQRGRVQHVELNVYHSEIVASANGKTVEILDVGPDHFFVRDGDAYLALTGRSITGSGVIGHVVVNLETGEVVLEAGNVQGDWVSNLCAELAA